MGMAVELLKQQQEVWEGSRVREVLPDDKVSWEW